MLDALLAGVIVDEAGALVRDFDARTIGCRRRRAATGGTAYRLHRKMETRHRRALDRKSTRLNPVTNAHLVCRLLLEKKKKNKNKQSHIDKARHSKQMHKTKQAHSTNKIH